jgi:hypothetical protein
LPLVVEVTGEAVDVLDGPARRELGQLEGRLSARFRRPGLGDGTPDRALVRFLVRAGAGTTLTVEARHPRAGRDRRVVVLEG